jgi:hypothetical protein
MAETVNQKVIKRQPCIARSSFRIDTWKALPSPRVIPTHLPSGLFPGTAFEHHAKLVYVVRDPKDVAVSLYHFHRSIPAQGDSGRLEKIFHGDARKTLS